ncbi:MAG: hypothetical protein JF886_02590 [Candidatus Dormibacteraeota bacterium]|uniref:Uncharacterized protein n=1 Tax=Candidatus Aeolococcus gillhamiae TaxID=3127015 RepID=A0A934JRK2_9BACT|nr:hypothetical protein [Candidatus Dormibacteraeota bacterium]
MLTISDSTGKTVFHYDLLNRNSDKVLPEPPRVSWRLGLLSPSHRSWGLDLGVSRSGLLVRELEDANIEAVCPCRDKRLRSE